MRKRFNLDLLDEDDPFEFDTGNTPHLMKRQFDPDDVRDVWANEPVFWQAAEDGAADWIMVGYVPGEVLVVPLAPHEAAIRVKRGPSGYEKQMMARSIDTRCRDAESTGGRDMDDRAAFEQYDDPASSKLQGEARGRKSKTPLSTHVPIRFRPELIELVKHFAEQDGRTVSSWIRHLVERAVRAREAAESRTLVRYQGQVTAFRVSRSLAPSSTTEVEEFVEGLDLVAQG